MSVTKWQKCRNFNMSQNLLGTCIGTCVRRLFEAPEVCERTFLHWAARHRKAQKLDGDGIGALKHHQPFQASGRVAPANGHCARYLNRDVRCAHAQFACSRDRQIELFATGL